MSSLTITFILTSVLERKLAFGINKISWKQQKVINAFERLYHFFFTYFCLKEIKCHANDHFYPKERSTGLHATALIFTSVLKFFIL